MNEYLWIVKLVAITVILAHVKILDAKNAIIYTFGVSALAFYAPEKAVLLPEFVMAASTAAFTAYLFLNSAAAHTKSFRITALKPNWDRIRYCYLDPFLSMLAISAALFSLMLNGWGALILSFIVIAIFDAANSYKCSSSPPPNHFLRASVLIGVFIAALAMKKYAAIFDSLRISVIYVSLLWAYYLIKSTYTRPYKINQLITGMIPAETIIVMNGAYQRQTMLPSIYAVLRSQLFKKSNVKELIGPFKSLDAKTIKELKSTVKKNKIEYILIQKTIDFSTFVVLGLIATYFFIKMY